MGEVVDIKGPPAHPESDLELIADCCRYQEGILTEAAVKKRHHYSDDVWEALGSNEALLEAVSEEKIRRIRTGLQKRERSQHLITKGPAILDSIAADVSASPRHRVDALKVLNDFAADPMANSPAAAADRFIINIDLSGGGGGSEDILRFNKSIAIDANDTDGDSRTATPGMPAAIAPNKAWDDNSQDNKSISAHDTDGSATTQMDLFATPVKQGAERLDVYESIKAMSAAERSALKSFLELENG